MILDHSVRQGRHDYSPGHGNLPCRAKSSFGLTFSIGADAWFDPSQKGPIGRDGKDWNKLGGYSYFSPFRPRTWAKNASAALIGWRPSDQPGRFEISAYTNDAKKGWRVTPVMTVKADEVIHVEVIVRRPSVTYKFDGKEAVVHPFRPWGWCLPVGPWFGGNRTAPVAHTISTYLS